MKMPNGDLEIEITEEGMKLKMKNTFTNTLFIAAIAALFNMVFACTALVTPAAAAEAAANDCLGEPPLPDDCLEISVEKNANAFNWELYEKLAAESEDENIFYSPYSIYEAMSMTWNGAMGDTAFEMQKAMHFMLPPNQWNPLMKNLHDTLLSRGQDTGGADGGKFQLSVANALWGQDGFNIAPAFLDALNEFYGAGFQLVDYIGDTEAARNKINTWVEDETENKIKDLISPNMLDKSTRLVLTNAIYFNAAWEKQFEEGYTQEQPFTLLDGSEISTDMMRQESTFRYTEGQDYQAASLPYKDDEISMVVILPAPGKFKEIETAKGENSVWKLIDGLYSKGGYQKLDLQLPKFRIETQALLADILTAMGMPLAFSNAADFTGITKDEPLKIDQVVHKAFVEVDENGTEAAAATAVLAKATAAPVPVPVVEFNCNRPFIFVIRDNATGAILFTGRVADPS